MDYLDRVQAYSIASGAALIVGTFIAAKMWQRFGPLQVRYWNETGRAMKHRTPWIAVAVLSLFIGFIAHYWTGWVVAYGVAVLAAPFVSMLVMLVYRRWVTRYLDQVEAGTVDPDHARKPATESAPEWHELAWANKEFARLYDGSGLTFKQWERDAEVRRLVEVVRQMNKEHSMDEEVALAEKYPAQYSHRRKRQLAAYIAAKRAAASQED